MRNNTDGKLWHTGKYDGGGPYASSLQCRLKLVSAAAPDSRLADKLQVAPLDQQTAPRQTDVGREQAAMAATAAIASDLLAQLARLTSSWQQAAAASAANGVASTIVDGLTALDVVLPPHQLTQIAELAHIMPQLVAASPAGESREGQSNTAAATRAIAVRHELPPAPPSIGGASPLCAAEATPALTPPARSRAARQPLSTICRGSLSGPLRATAPPLAAISAAHAVARVPSASKGGGAQQGALADTATERQCLNPWRDRSAPALGSTTAARQLAHQENVRLNYWRASCVSSVPGGRT